MAKEENYNVRSIYDTISSTLDVGDYETFAKSIKDPKNAIAVHKAISEDYDVGDEKTFLKSIGLAGESFGIGKVATRVPEYLAAREQDPFNLNKPDPKYISDVREIKKAQSIDSQHIGLTSRETISALRNNNPVEFIKQLGMSSLDYVRPSLAENLRSFKFDDKTYSDNSKDIDNILLPPDAVKYLEDRKVMVEGVGMEGSGIRAIDKNLEKVLKSYYFLNPTGQQEYKQHVDFLDKSNKMLSSADQRNAAALEKAVDDLRQLSAAPAWGEKASEGRANELDKQRTRVIALNAERRKIDEMKNTLEAYEQGRTKNGAVQVWGEFSRMFGETSLDILTIGAKGLIESLQEKDIVDKRNKGEDLSEEEEDFLASAAIANYMQDSYSGERTAYQNVTQSIMGSLPYMTAFATLGGGIARSITKGATGTAKAAIRLAFKQGMGKSMARTLGIATDVVDMTARGGIQTLIDPHTYDLAIQNMNGSYGYEVDQKTGKVSYSGQKNNMSFADALVSAYTVQMVENLSEYSGMAFAPVSGAIGRGIRKGLEGKLPDLAKFIYDDENLFNTVNYLMHRAGWNGTIGEFAEEQIATIGHAAFGDGQGEWKDLIDGEKQLLTLATVMAISSGAWAINKGGNALVKQSINADYKNTSASLNKAFLEDSSVVGMLLTSQNVEENKETLRGILASDKYTDEQKKAALEFYVSSTRYFSYQAAKQKRIEDESKKITDKIKSMDNDGQIITAKIGEAEVAIKGNVVLDQDGTINYTASDNTVTYTDQDGNVQIISTSQLKEVQIIPTAQAAKDALDAHIPILMDQMNDEEQPEYKVKQSVRVQVGEGLFAPVVIKEVKNGGYVVVDETGAESLVRPSQIVNESSIDGVVPGDVVEYYDESGKVISGEVNDIESTKKEGVITINENLVPISSVVGKAELSAPKEIAGYKVVGESSPVGGERIFIVIDENGNERFLTADGKEVVPQKVAIPEQEQSQQPSVQLPNAVNQINQVNTPNTLEPKAPELPLDKSGNVDYNLIDDAETLKSALDSEFGSEAIDVLGEMSAEAGKKLSKAESLDDAIAKRRETKVLRGKLDLYKNVNDLYVSEKESLQKQETIDTTSDQNVSENKNQTTENQPDVISENAESFPKSSPVINEGEQKEKDIEEKRDISEEVRSQNPELNPTEEQKKTGEYKKARVNVQGFDITIETPKEVVRTGKDKDGEVWSTQMKAHYGEFTDTAGKDGDGVDVFIGDHPESATVFVIDQVNPDTGMFDESKVMLGFKDIAGAKAAYLGSYEKGWNGLSAITPVGIEDFKAWLYDGARQNKAFSGYVNSKNTIYDSENGTGLRSVRGSEKTDGSPILGEGETGTFGERYTPAGDGSSIDTFIFNGRKFTAIRQTAKTVVYDDNGQEKRVKISKILVPVRDLSVRVPIQMDQTVENIDTINDEELVDEVYNEARLQNIELSDPEALGISAAIKSIASNEEILEDTIKRTVGAFVEGKKNGTIKTLETNKKATGSAITTPNSTYNEAVRNNHAESGNNLWMRQSNDQSNEDRVLMVQVSSNLISGKQKFRRKKNDSYFDKLYRSITGYDRTVDFWEIPTWMGRISAMESKADVYVVRDAKEAEKFISEAGYGRVLFSVMDATKQFVVPMIEANPGQVFQIGVYTKFKEIEGFDNVKTFSTIDEYAAENGLELSLRYSYLHFVGTSSIPRLRTSQGCKYKCAFCSNTSPVKALEDKDVMEQVEGLKDLNMKFVYIGDKAFGQADNLKIFKQIYDRIKQFNPDFEGFIVQTSARDFADTERMTPEFLAEAHIKYVELGIETYNDEILTKLRKRHSHAKYVNAALDNARINGIKIIPNIIVGLSGKNPDGTVWSETRETYENTLNFLNENRDIISHLNVYSLALYEGTDLGDEIGAKIETDASENSVIKSFHQDKEIHAEYLDKFSDFASDQLDRYLDPASAMVDNYVTRLTKLKEQNPEKYWSVDMPSNDVLVEAAREGRISDVGGAMGVVTKEGEMIGLFKYVDTAKESAAKVQEERVTKMGGYFFDSYDTAKNIEIYKKNGFKEVGRMKFDANQAPQDMPEALKETSPDVVFMIYDPKNEITVKQKVFKNYEEGQKYAKENGRARLKFNTSENTQEFFSDVVTGKSDKFVPKVPWAPIAELTEEQNEFYGDYKEMGGNFDDHIACSIPGFRDMQIKTGVAVSKLLPNGGLVYDIGGSEGTWIKAITKRSGGKIRSISLDPNKDMAESFSSTPVEGSGLVTEAFYEGFDDNGHYYRAHTPAELSDVVHESMTFQFVSSERAPFIKELKKRYMKPDGIFITEEKLIPESQDQYQANEAKKDRDFKAKYFTPEQIQQKGEVVLVGMKKDQAKRDEYVALLNQNFKYVFEYWDSGNFKGYIATDSKKKADTFMSSVGNNDNEFSEKNIQVKGVDRVQLQIVRLPETININGVDRPTTNSNGKPIHSTEEGVRNFWRWFGDSKVVDEQGRPLVVYHGTQKGRSSAYKVFSEFMESTEGIFFTNKRSVSGWFGGRNVGINGSYTDALSRIKDKSFESLNEFTKDHFGISLSLSKDKVSKKEASEFGVAPGVFYALQFDYENGSTVFGRVGKPNMTNEELNEAVYKKIESLATGYDYEVNANGSYTHEAYLKIENPISIDNKGNNFLNVTLPDGSVVSANMVAGKIDKSKNDGSIIENIKETTSLIESTDYIALLPTQIKSAMENSGEFDGTGNINTQIQQEENLPSEFHSNMTDDGQGNYAFFHYGKFEGNIVDPSAGKRHSYTTDRTLNPVSYFYTKRDDSERMINGDMHVVLVPKGKVYPFNADPDNFYDQALINFRNSERGSYGQSFDPDMQLAYITDLATKAGYEMIVAKWGRVIKLRAQSELPIESMTYNEFQDHLKNIPKFTPISEEFDKQLGDILEETGLAKIKRVFGGDAEMEQILKEIGEGNGSLQTLSEMESIKSESISNGTFMLAPNGKATKLNENQWLQVRTKAFKEWFGDWQNDPENSSKVIDINGEPLVVYHGSPITGTVEFDTNAEPIRSRTGIQGTYFTSSNYSAANYKERGRFGQVYPCFINLKTPLNTTKDIAKIRRRKNINSFGEAKAEALKAYDPSIHDGVVFNGNSWNVDEFTAINPTQIKSAISNDGSFSVNNPDIRFQVIAGAEVYYSTVERALANISQEKGTKDQFKAMLLKNGAKQAEMDWMGFDELPEKLTKTDIQNWIDENKIEIKEVEKWTPTDDDIDVLLSDELGEDMNRDEAMEYLLNEDTSPLFKKYQLPGGENYKEMLLTMPSKTESIEVSSIKEEVEYERKGYYITSFGGKNFATKNPSKFHSFHFEEPNIIAHMRINERISSIQNPNYKDKKTHIPNFDTDFELVEYPDSYAVKNKLSGIEYFNKYSKKIMEDNKMSAEDLKVYLMKNSELGKKHSDFSNNPMKITKRVLFIEEIQSDWAQKGRKYGFKGDVDYEPVLEQENVWNVGGVRVLYFERGVDGNNYRTINEKSEQVWHNNLEDAVKEANNTVKNISEKEMLKAPDMPFKKTDQWVNLVLRRIIRHAAENGFDMVSWTTGEQQAERYDLSKQVDYISYNKKPSNYEEGKIFVSVSTQSGSIVSKNMTPTEIEETVGKEIAKKIIDGEDYGKLEGLDLKVGGEGMKSFYDGIVPTLVNKLVKPFGVKVESIYLDTDATDFIYNTDNTIVEKSKKISDRYILKNSNGDMLYDKSFPEGYGLEEIHKTLLQKARENTDNYVKALSAQQSISITPEMRESFNNGIPLFMKDRNGIVYGFNYNGVSYLNSKRMNANTPIHEFAHPFLDMLENEHKELFEKGVELVKKSPYYDQVKSDPNYSSNSPMQIVKEAMARAIGDRGEQVVIKKGLGQQLKDWIKSVWEAIGKAFNINSMTSDQIQNLTFTQFVDVSVATLLSGKQITAEQAQDENLMSEITGKIKRNFLRDTFKFKKLHEEGVITNDKDLSDFNGNRMVLHKPDMSMVGNIVLRDGTSIRAKGGVYFPIEFKEEGFVWACNTLGAANSLANALNTEAARAKKEGKSSVMIALVGAGKDKVVSSAIGANTLIDLFASKTIGTEYNITRNMVKNALSFGLKEKSPGRDAKGRKIMIGVGVDLPSSTQYDQMISKTKEFLSSENITFPQRSVFVTKFLDKLIAQISDKKTKDKLKSAMEYFYEPLKTNKQNGVSRSSMIESLGSLMTEPTLRDVNKDEVYAIIEIQIPETGKAVVSSKFKGHESYGYAIKATQEGQEIKVHMLTDRKDWTKVFNNKEGEDISSPKKVMTAQSGTSKFAAELKYQEIPESRGTISLQIIGSTGAKNIDEKEEIAFRINDLSTAKQMELAGKTPIEIRNATGWERGVDHMWRYEILDISIGEKGLAKLYKAIGGAIEGGDKPGMSLSELLSNDEASIAAFEELSTAYPIFKDVKKVSVKKTLKETFAMAVVYKQGGVNDILIPLKKLMDLRSQTDPVKREAMLSFVNRSLIHEIQHIIQREEGFALGSSEEEANSKESLQAAINRIQDFYNSKIDEIRTSQEYLDYVDMKRRAFISLDQVPNMSRIYEMADSHFNVDIFLEGKRNDISRAKKGTYGYFAYHRTAGEVEARNASKRSGMDPELRVVDLISSTQDVRNEDQIVILDQVVEDETINTIIASSGLPPVEANNDLSTPEEINANDINRENTRALRKSIQKKNSSIWAKLVESHQNRIRPVLIFFNELKKIGIEIADADNYYMKFTAVGSKIQFQIEQFEKNLFRPLQKVIRNFHKAGVSYDGLIAYVQFKHADEYTKAMNKKRSGDDIEDLAGKKALEDRLGMSAEEVISYVESSAGAELVEKLWENIRKVTAYSLDNEVRGGFVTEEQREKIGKMFEFYIPLRGHRNATASEIFDYTERRGEYFVPTVKEAKGRTSEASDPFAYMRAMAMTSTSKAEDNILKQTWIRIAKKPNAGLIKIDKTWHVMVGEKNGKKVFEVAPEVEMKDGDTIEQYNKRVAEFEEEMWEKAKKGEAFRRGEKNLGFEFFIKPAEARKHEVNVWRNGVSYTVRFATDPRIPESINGANMRHYDGAYGETLKSVGNLTRFMAAAKTMYRPAFIFITNPIRDMQQSFQMNFIDKGLGFTTKFALNIPKAIAGLSKYYSGIGFDPVANELDRHIINYMAGGAKTGKIKMLEINTIQKQVKREINRIGSSNIAHIPVKGWELFTKMYSTFGDITENQFRVATYITALETGLSPERAISMAKDVTLNFDRTGNGRNMQKELKTMMAFYNVGWQALDNMYKKSTQSPTAAFRASAVLSANVAMGYFIITGLNSMIAHCLGEDDRDWKDMYSNVPEFTRNSNILIYTGKENGFASIPLSQELKMFYGLGSDLFMFQEGYVDAATSAQNILLGLSSLVSYNPVESVLQDQYTELAPDVVRSLVEIQANKNYLGGQIYNSYKDAEPIPGYKKIRVDKRNKPVAPEVLIYWLEQLDKATGGDGVVPGKLSLNPDVVNHIMYGYMAGLYGQFMDASEAIYTDDAGSLLELKPLFKKASKIRESGYVKDYYDIANEIETTISYHKKYIEEYGLKNLSREETEKKLEIIGVDKSLYEASVLVKTIDKYTKIAKKMEGEAQDTAFKNINELKKRVVQIRGKRE
jgi:hypothetical protein